MLPPHESFIGVARLDATVERIDRQAKACDPQGVLTNLFADAPACLEMHSAFSRYLLKGWHEDQEVLGCAIRWTRQEFSFILHKKHADYLCLNVCSFMPSIENSPIQATVSTAGNQLGHFLVSYSDFRDIRLNISEYNLSGSVKFIVRLNKTWIPKQSGESVDDRELGILVQKIWLE